jgi:putative colanic acid biosynthesis acetyltransferase WcaF
VKILDAESSNSKLGGPSFSLGNRAFRIVWRLSWLLLAAWTPPPLHRWRCFVVNLFGASIDPTARVYGSASIWYPPHLTMGRYSCLGPRVNCYCIAPVFIGDYAIVSQSAHLCTGSHDIKSELFQLTAHEIRVGKNAWIAAEAFVGPGVEVAEGAVIGARAVIFTDAEKYSVYIGNPAQFVKRRNMATKL